MPILISFLTFVFSITGYQGGLHVTTDAQSVTFFSPSEYSGTIGILGHDDVAGASFAQLQDGDVVTLAYPSVDKRTGENKVRRFVVTDIQSYSVLNPYDDPPAWTIRYFDSKGDGLSAYQLFEKIYASKHGLVLQTCKDGVAGRLFVIAEMAR
jgi:hypothetical protein